MPEPERVWVVVDGVGQPCLRWVRHRGVGDREPPALPKGLTDDGTGPYQVEAYSLFPAGWAQRKPEAD